MYTFVRCRTGKDEARMAYIDSLSSFRGSGAEAAAASAAARVAAEGGPTVDQERNGSESEAVPRPALSPGVMVETGSLHHDSAAATTAESAARTASAAGTAAGIVSGGSLHRDSAAAAAAAVPGVGKAAGATDLSQPCKQTEKDPAAGPAASLRPLPRATTKAAQEVQSGINRGGAESDAVVSLKPGFATSSAVSASGTASGPVLPSSAAALPASLELRPPVLILNVPLAEPPLQAAQASEFPPATACFDCALAEMRKFVGCLQL